jgi:Zn-dependent protease with chaperone function
MNNRVIGQNVLRSFIAGIIAIFFYVLFTRLFTGTVNGNTLRGSLLIGASTLVIAFVISSLFTLYFSRKKGEISK